MSRYYDYNPQDELIHYGVKGMKWGKKKAAASSKKSDYVDDLQAKYDINSLDLRTKDRAMSRSKSRSKRFSTRYAVYDRTNRATDLIDRHSQTSRNHSATRHAQENPAKKTISRTISNAALRTKWSISKAKNRIKNKIKNLRNK